MEYIDNQSKYDMLLFIGGYKLERLYYLMYISLLEDFVIKIKISLVLKNEKQDIINKMIFYKGYFLIFVIFELFMQLEGFQ